MIEQLPCVFPQIYDPSHIDYATQEWLDENFYDNAFINTSINASDLEKLKGHIVRIRKTDLKILTYLIRKKGFREFETDGPPN